MWWFAKRVADISGRLAGLARCPRCQHRYAPGADGCPRCAGLSERELNEYLAGRKAFRVSLGKAMMLAAVGLRGFLRIGN